MKGSKHSLRHVIGHFEDVNTDYLFGPPMSGKGEWVNLVNMIFNENPANRQHFLGSNRVAVIGMSNLADRHIREQTDLGKRFLAAREDREKGGLYSDTDVTTALAEEIAANASQGVRHFVIDGYIRTEAQGKEVILSNVNYRVYNIEMELNHCLTLRERRLQQQNRPDDQKVEIYIKRFNLFKHKGLKGLQVVKRHNKDLVTPVDGCVGIRQKLMAMFKNWSWLQPEDMEKIVGRMDNQQDAVYEKIKKLETPFVRAGRSFQLQTTQQRALAA